ncbi:MmgE/PrpD family protein [Paraburkholderia fungorum]|jgi:2-methylcitrate dehydratase PrpD|uniref:MmgE/PrpD family protein n=1 Tax=Paraburkholderia fungorum TaxID=134537 RepID=UPI0038BAF5EB
MKTSSLLDELASFTADASAGAGRERLALHLADASIALMAGMRSTEGHAVAALIHRTEASPLAHSARLAAVMRLSEIDDIHRSSAVTASAIAVPCALAMRALATDADPARFIDAIFVGQEVALRLALAMGGAALLAQGLWPTYLVAPFGAAATTARLLGLNVARTAEALAMALAQTPRAVGRTPRTPCPGRWALFGNAVRAGCFAALAAADGIDGDTGLLTDAWLAGIRGAPADATPLRGLDAASPLIAQTSIKPHCSAKQSLAAIHGLRELLARGLDAARIDAIEVEVPSAYAGMIARESPAASRIASLVSAPGQLALAALQPALLDDVSRDALDWSGPLGAFAANVTVRAEPALDALYPRQWPARVTVIAGPRREQILVVDSPGDPALPFDAAALIDKATRVIGGRRGRDLVQTAMNACRDASALEALCHTFDVPVR